MKTIELVKNILIDKGYNENDIFFIALYGSQNYELDTKNSDLDFKVVIFPNLSDLLRGNFISKVYDYTYGQMDVKSINNMITMWKKQNPAYLEIIDTKFIWVNPIYQDYFNKIKSLKIYTLNYDLQIKAIKGMFFQKEKALTHEFPGTKDKIDKYGYDPKQLHHMLRLKDLLFYVVNNLKVGKEVNINDFSYKDTKDFLIEVKEGKFSLDEALELSKKLNKEIKELEIPDNLTFKNEIDKELHELYLEIMYNKIKKEFS